MQQQQSYEHVTCDSLAVLGSNWTFCGTLAGETVILGFDATAAATSDSSTSTTATTDTIEATAADTAASSTTTAATTVSPQQQTEQPKTLADKLLQHSSIAAAAAASAKAAALAQSALKPQHFGVLWVLSGRIVGAFVEHADSSADSSAVGAERSAVCAIGRYQPRVKSTRQLQGASLQALLAGALCNANCRCLYKRLPDCFTNCLTFSTSVVLFWL
jgi:hypothetical protein